MKKIYLNILRFSVGIILLLFLFYKVGVKEVYISITNLNLIYILPMLFFYIFIFLVEAYNQKILTDKLKKIPFKKFMKYHMLSWSVGMFVPGKIGQFSMVQLLKKEGISLGRGLAAVLLDKLTTLLTLFILTALSLLLFFELQFALKIIALIAAAGIIFSFLIFHSGSRKLVKRFILRKHAEKFEGFSSTMKEYAGIHKDALISNFLITFLKWGISAAMVFFLFLSFNYPVDYIKIILIMPAGVLVSFIPISISGIGTREATAAFLYSAVGVAASVVLSVYLLNLAMNYLLAIACTVIFMHEFGK